MNDNRYVKIVAPDQSVMYMHLDSESVRIEVFGPTIKDRRKALWGHTLTPTQLGQVNAFMTENWSESLYEKGGCNCIECECITGRECRKHCDCTSCAKVGHAQ